jgi:acyltransferase
MIKDKIHWIDNLKTLGILAVILGHIASPLGNFIYSWHMPLFFILAGFFIKFDLTIKEFIKKDFKRLMIPYFIFTFIGLSLETVKRIALHRDSLDYIHELEGIFFWMDMSSLINSYTFVLWFLPTLFFARVFLVVVCKYIQTIIFQFIVVSILFSISFYTELPFAIDNSLNAILFLFIGNIFFKYYQDFKLLYILPIIGLGLYFFIGIPSLDMARKFYSDIFINLFFALAIIYSMIIILKKLDFASRLFNVWGSNTMLLFIVHPYTNNIAYIIVEKIHFGDWYLKFFISLILLQLTLFIKQKFENKGIFKYV